MPSERFKLVSAVHLFLIRDSKILLLRRFNTGYEDGNYSVPAGHLDGGEPVTVAMARETREETGLSIHHSQFSVVHTMHRASPADTGAGSERIDFFILATLVTVDPQITEPDKCDDLSWFELTHLPENVIPYVRSAIDCYIRGVTFSEFGWN